MTASVHPLALVEDGAKLGEGVEVGPFCHVGKEAVLGDGVRLVSGVTVMGATTIGPGTSIFPGAVIGAPPQNLKHKGGRTTLVIGRDCTIREGVTIHVGSDTERGATIVGDRCFLMVDSHIAHDCIVGNGVVMANNATLGGHVELGDNVNIGGLAAVHQFVRIGRNAFVGGLSAVVGDLIPFGMALGQRARLRGFNVIGLKRAGMGSKDLMRMRQAYRQLFAEDRPLSENLALVRAEHGEFGPMAEILDFLSARGRRHFVVPPRRGGQDDDGGAD